LDTDTGEHGWEMDTDTGEHGWEISIEWDTDERGRELIQRGYPR